MSESSGSDPGSDDGEAQVEAGGLFEFDAALAGVPAIQELSSPSETPRPHEEESDSGSEYEQDEVSRPQYGTHHVQQYAASSDDMAGDSGDQGYNQQDSSSDDESMQDQKEYSAEGDDRQHRYQDGDDGDDDYRTNEGDEEEDEDEEDDEEEEPEQDFTPPAPSNIRRQRSARPRRGRVPMNVRGLEEEEDRQDLSVAMRIQREINSEGGLTSRRRSARVASQGKRPVYDEGDGAIDDAFGDEESSDGEEAGDSEDDEEAARRIDREINGLRTRATRRTGPGPNRPTRSTDRGGRGRAKKGGTGRWRQQDSDDESPAPRRGSRATRTSNQAIDRKKYVEDSGDDEDSDDAAERREKRAAQQKAMISGPCSANGFFISPYPEDLDDEVERVLGHRDVEGIDPDPNDIWRTREFRIKWKRYAYIHSSWDTLATLEQLPGIKRVQNYIKRVDELVYQMGHLSPEEQELINVERQMQEELIQDHMKVERIMDEFVDGEDTKYLVKWTGLPYSEATWELKETLLNTENGVDGIDDYQAREARLLEPSRTVEQQRKSFLLKGHRALAAQPKYLAGGELRDYQLAGLNWLVYSWSQDNNVILADEMGLGKTIQCVSLLAYLAQTLTIMGPFLVIVPLSTVHNWVKEFTRWAPQCNTVVYVGDSTSRGVARRYEFYTNRKTGRQHRFEVLISTFEVALKDANVLGKIKWSYMLMDEAHRLKNHESALYMELMTWQFKNKLLVTGTPLQNSVQELWALLHFLEPEKFNDLDLFVETHSLDSDEGISSLHRELGPHLLRRVIKDVEKSLPPKNERILRVEMTPLQKQYYKWILNRNFEALNKGARGGGHVSLLNIITELKKTCNHPFLFESAEESYRGKDESSAIDRIVSTSGKMVILDKLLQRLKATGHRVLIFSQMVRVLDIISEYLRLRGYCHQRLDGSTPAQSRQQAMAHFNAEGSQDFAFLLSTRAGGLGINLATADTVVIFDSDWNPQNDLQAMSRAHRIGQKETVNIYRFVTSGSVEENILERAKQKMVLDHVVIQRMDTSGRMVLDPRGNNQSAKIFDKEELAAILRFGAEKLFKNEEGDEEGKGGEDEEDIDDILARAEKVETTAASTQATGASELLSQFSYATFKNEEDDATFWSRLIPKEDRMKTEEEETLLPRSARLKTEAPDSYAEPELESPKPKRQPRREIQGRTGSQEKSMAAGPPLESCQVRIDSVTVPGKDDAAQAIVTLSKKEAHAFVRAVRKFGILSRMQEIAAESNSYVAEELDNAGRKALYNALMDGCERSIKAHAEAPIRVQDDDSKEGEKPEKRGDAQLDFFGHAVKAADMISVVEKMEMLYKKLQPYQTKPSHYRLDTAAQMSAPKWGASIGWSPREDAMLLMGVCIHGLSNWDKIVADEALGLGDKLGSKDAAADGKLPKPSHLETRALGLMKKMETLQRKPPKGPSALRPDKLSFRSRPMVRGGLKASSVRVKRESSRDGDSTDQEGRIRTAKRPKIEKPNGTTIRTKAVSVDPEKLLEDIRVTLKKLRTLQRHKDIPKEQAIAKTKKYLKLVGKHIDDVSADKDDELSGQLWQWVSKFTENPLGGERLKMLYSKLCGPPTSTPQGGETGDDRRTAGQNAGPSHRSGDSVGKRGRNGGDGNKWIRSEERHSGQDRRDPGNRERSRDPTAHKASDKDRKQGNIRDRNFDFVHGSPNAATDQMTDHDRVGEVIGRRAPVR